MHRFKFNKLVRDNIVDNIIKSGGKVKYKVLNKDNLRSELVNKITEEAQEILTAKTDNLASEIADVQQAIDDLIKVCGLTPAGIKSARDSKLKKAGAFKNGYFVECVDVDENNEWFEYYRKNPERYPEI